MINQLRKIGSKTHSSSRPNSITLERSPVPHAVRGNGVLLHSLSRVRKSCINTLEYYFRQVPKNFGLEGLITYLPKIYLDIKNSTPYGCLRKLNGSFSIG